MHRNTEGTCLVIQHQNLDARGGCIFVAGGSQIYNITSHFYFYSEGQRDRIDTKDQFVRAQDALFLAPYSSDGNATRVPPPKPHVVSIFSALMLLGVVSSFVRPPFFVESMKCHHLALPLLPICYFVLTTHV